MIRRKMAGLALAAAAAFPLHAQEGDACAAPGIPVSSDPAGDHTIAATGQGFPDILSLHMAEPGGGPNLVFTYKMADLALLPPDTVWMIRFLTDAIPTAEIAEYFVAMLTAPDASVHLVYGTAASADPAGQAGLLFTPQGALEQGSGFEADGTITLVLDKSRLDGLQPGGSVYGMIPVTHRITPTDGTMPFAYGFRALAAAVLSYDDGTDGFYEVVGPEGCGGGKSLLGVGAMGGPAVLALALAALVRLRRRH